MSKYKLKCKVQENRYQTIENTYLNNYLVKILILHTFPNFLGMTENEFSINLVKIL